ncbi:MAG: HAD family phosphatase [Bifidobacterium sp.]|jgi:HAD superfamily hydrolase (TIGR01509 family)|nr:HAD family phosphatase [Bifidobacterium sp.]MCI1865692.1 HAD family phosphatase [Bifidobacterium sp.]
MSSEPPTDVVFDFCGVLIDWQCRACLEGHFPQPLVERICADDDPYGFYRYEDHMDAGQPFSRVIVEYRQEFGDEMADVFRYYIGHYGDSLPSLIPGAQRLLEDLRRAGIGTWGLTNWSYETIHTAFDRFPRLADLLGGTIVSGQEGMHKPDPDIYRLAMSRFGLVADRSVFFDDTEKNVQGAMAVGMRSFRFTGVALARVELESLGVRL